VLTQIIVEEESKGQNLLPISFLRQLIGLYGDQMQWMVPRYLEQAMQSFAHNQDQLRHAFQNTMSGMFPFGGALEEMSKQNVAMFEQAMKMWSPFGEGQGAGGAPAPASPAGASPAPASAAAAEDAARQAEQRLAEMQRRLDELHAQLRALDDKDRGDKGG
jgi:polyhydroxyalkanoate synthesis regulator protein